MAKTPQKLTYRLRYDENHLDRWIDLKCSPAKQRVVISREVKDVLSARAGSTIACMNSNCAHRLQNSFPHKVYLAVFTASAAYFVDRLKRNGQPDHCVWYRHNDGESVGIHDKFGPQEIIKRGIANKTIVLRPPQRMLNRKQIRKQTSKPRPESPGPKKEALPVGARRRAVAAGILVLP